MAFGSYVLVDDDYDLNDLLDEVAARCSAPDPGPLRLMEAATRWDEAKHPRWPKGTPRAGQFMDVGQEFMFGGKRYELSFLGSEGGGRLYAHLSEGPEGVQLKEFEVSFEMQDGKQVPVLAGVTEAPAKTFKAGKGTDLTGLTTDPYVDASSHDPSLQLPKVPGVKITADEWKAFGRADQENFIRLAQEFGKYAAGENAALVKKQMGSIDTDSKNAVLHAFSAQHGSSTGTNFNFAGMIHGITDKLKLTSAQRRREKAIRALGEIAAVIQWDLYNRTHAPDITVFHRDSSHGPSYWQSTHIDMHKPIMSGLSQSWKYSPSHLSSWGDTILVTPLAIREVVMSNHSVQPASALGQHEGYKGELEIATGSMLRLDSRSVVISESKQLSKDPTIKGWLASLCAKPSGGGTARELAAYVKSGKVPPLPPAPPKITMDGSGGKTYVPPPLDVGAAIEQDATGKPLPSPVNVSALGYAQVDESGNPIASPANQLNLQPGSIIEGMAGSRYVILADPANPTFPFVRAELTTQGTWMGENKTFSFSEGGGKTFKLIDGFIPIAKPKSEEETGPLWDPEAWANGSEEEFTPKLPVGSIFKVNDIPYQVIGPIPGSAEVKVQSLDTGKFGHINPDYKATPMVPKEGYVAPTEHQTKPAPGVTFAYQGEKYQVTVLLKNGLVQAKRWGKPGVIKLQPDDPALASKNLHDPEAFTFGDEVAIGQLQPGEKFHGGTGVLTQKPYVVVGPGENDPKKVLVKSLDDGSTFEAPPKKKYRLLVAKADDIEPGGEANPNAHIPQNWSVGKQQTLGTLMAGEKFVFGVGDLADRQPLIEVHGEVTLAAGEMEDTSKMRVKLLTGVHAGELHDVPADTPSFLLLPHEAGDGPVTAYDPSVYLPGPKKTMGDMPVGTVFLSSKGVPYVVTKTGMPSGALATNLVTGKSWPAIKYHREFDTALPKNGTKVPYSKLTTGDVVEAAELKEGDQFGRPGTALWQVVTPGDPTGDSEQGPIVRELTPWGLASQTELGGGRLLVEFYAKKGEGYDPLSAEVPVPLDGGSLNTVDPVGPGNPDLPDAQVDGNLSTFTASHLDADPSTYFQLQSVAAGVVGFDMNGKPWLIKQPGPITIVSDGHQLFETTGQLIVREPDGAAEDGIAQALQAGDDAPKLGDQSDMTWAVAEANMSPNGAGIALKDMEVGQFFHDIHGVTWRLKSKTPEDQSLATADNEFGDTHTYFGNYVPVNVAQLTSVFKPDAAEWNENDWKPELKTTQLMDLAVGDRVYYAEQPYLVQTPWPQLGATNLYTGTTIELSGAWDGPNAVKMVPKEPYEQPVSVQMPKPKVGDPVYPSQLQAGDVFTAKASQDAKPIQVVGVAPQGDGQTMLTLKYEQPDDAVGLPQFDMPFSDSDVRKAGGWTLVKSASEPDSPATGFAPATATLAPNTLTVGNLPVGTWVRDKDGNVGQIVTKDEADGSVQISEPDGGVNVAGWDYVPPAAEPPAPSLIGHYKKGDTLTIKPGALVVAQGSTATQDTVWTVKKVSNAGNVVALEDALGNTTATNVSNTVPVDNPLYVPPAPTPATPAAEPEPVGLGAWTPVQQGLKPGGKVLPSQLEPGMVIQPKGKSADRMKVHTVTDVGGGEFEVGLSYMGGAGAEDVYNLTFSDDYVKEQLGGWELVQLPGASGGGPEELPTVDESQMKPGPTVQGQDLKPGMVVKPWPDKPAFVVVAEQPGDMKSGGTKGIGLRLESAEGGKTGVLENKSYPTLVWSAAALKPQAAPEVPEDFEAKPWQPNAYQLENWQTELVPGPQVYAEELEVDDVVRPFPGSPPSLVASLGGKKVLVSHSGETTDVMDGPLYQVMVPKDYAATGPVKTSGPVAADANLGDIVEWDYGQWHLKGSVIKKTGSGQLTMALIDPPDSFTGGSPAKEFGMPSHSPLTSISPPNADEVVTDKGVFKVGDQVTVWASNWDEPKTGKLVSIDTPASEGGGLAAVVNVQYAGMPEGSYSAALGSWLQSPSVAPPHYDPAPGGYVTWTYGTTAKRAGTVVDWDPVSDTGHVRLDHKVHGKSAVMAVAAYQLTSYTPKENVPPPQFGDYVLGSELQPGDHIQVKGGMILKTEVAVPGPTGTQLKFTVIANPTHGQSVGSEFQGTWSDEKIAADAVKGEKSPWIKVDAPSAEEPEAFAGPGPPLPEGASYLGELEVGDQFTQKQGPNAPVYQVLHVTEDGEVDYFSVDSGRQDTTDGNNYGWRVKPPESPLVSKPVLPEGVIPPLKMQAQLDATIAKYGGVDAIPAIHGGHGLGYGSEWGSGGAIRYRPLDWVPDGGEFYIKGGGSFVRLAELGEGVVIVNVFTGDAIRVTNPAEYRVKPPKGKTWKHDPDS